MACACGKNRRQRTMSNPKPESKPVTVKFPDGTTKTFGTKLEAYAAKTIAGGGRVIDD